MKISKMVAGAVIASLAALPIQAQNVSSPAGTTVNVSSLVSEVTGNMMGGMKVTATWDDQTSISSFWGNIGSTWGANFGSRMRLSLGALDNTFDALWKVELFDIVSGEDPDLLTLVFEGGPSFGNVYFDRPTSTNCSPLSLTCRGQTSGSSTGYSFDILDQDGDGYTSSNANDFEQVAATYTNVVQFGANPIQYDLFSKVSVDFGPAFSGRNDDGPDVGDGSPFYFRMDTDVSVVPEPSTYALMAVGLAGIFGAARRRRRQQA